MPSLPACAGFVPSTPSAGGSPSGSLPEPFKPFAGQKPQRPSGQSGATAQGLEGLPAASLVRLLSTSLVCSGCGSVLEGIPFNIGFCSDADDHPSSPSSHHTLPHWPLSIDHDDGAPSDITRAQARRSTLPRARHANLLSLLRAAERPGILCPVATLRRRFSGTGSSRTPLFGYLKGGKRFHLTRKEVLSWVQTALAQKGGED
ncbi:hypothetical protein PtA15_2A218 [Puccinia triticina]|uniref:Uncharacterized protein n=1 Tax=Puccinia triticina TaxID=208348 RepID=A0ABY7CDH2_9BASI|nr:uncharacterized protein PtA15_2A218 [Puccinia triticina]WAQ81905.1 hypothetical protein PtA15_2A218 [Puccinia triticina]